MQGRLDVRWKYATMQSFISQWYLLALIGMDVFKGDQWLFLRSEEGVRKGEYFVGHKAYFICSVLKYYNCLFVKRA